MFSTFFGQVLSRACKKRAVGVVLSVFILLLCRKPCFKQFQLQLQHLQLAKNVSVSVRVSVGHTSRRIAILRDKLEI